MRDVMPGIRMRVDRLAAAVRSRTCDGQHALIHVSFVPRGDPVPGLAASRRGDLLPLRR